MATRSVLGPRRCIQQAISVLGIVALSVLAMLAVERVMSPPRATAQAGQAQEVRASAVVLVGPDGTVLARLGPGPNGGGNLMLLDVAGNPRVTLGAAGNISVRDANGTYRFLAGHTETTTGTAAMPLPPFSGVRLDPSGSIGVMP